MKLNQCLPCAAAFGIALFLVGPNLVAFTLTGDSLDLSQRGFRVFNNFSDPTANDNTVPDPDFPGATGAVLAFWKAVAEWGSHPHGFGFGDPTQDEIGNGDANFDAVFVGLATSPGDVNGNVFSQIDGSNGGLLGFTELPSSDGWRIRFYGDPFQWDDGPGIPVGTDLQGIATHEYGHVLGLGHSSVFGATMSAALSPVDARSIEADDIAGLQAIYGAKTVAKTFVDTYAIGPAGIAIEGANFDPSYNEVWFTHDAPTASKDPIKVLGLTASASGTRIDVVLPPGAGRGDLLVKAGAGSAFSALSNAIPFDPSGDPCTLPTAFGTPKTTSLGTLPAIESIGLPSASIGSFQVGTTNGLPLGGGVLFSGPTSQAAPFLGGTLYVAPPFTREAIFQFQDFSAFVDVPIEPASIGQTRYYQLFFRDGGDPLGVGLSNGLEVTFCP